MTQSPLSERDDLEHHLRSELRDYAPDAPDRLWAGIKARLPQRRRRRPVLWWWLAGAAMAGLFAGMAYRFNGEKPIVRDVPAQVAQSAPVMPIAWTTAKNTASGSAAAPVATKAVLPALEGTKHRENPVAGTALQGQTANTDILPVKTALENSRSLPGQTSNARTTVPLVTLLPVATLSALEHEKKSDLTFFTQAPRIEPVRDRRWEIGAVAGPVWLWQQAVTGAPGHTNHLAFAEQSEGPATGWQAGLSARFALHPRWRLNTGLWRRTTTQVSSHTAELRLMDGVCLNPYDLGPKVYEFQYALHSSGNESNLTVRIAQVDTMSTMPTDEPFLLTMRTSRQRTEWVLPLTMQRWFGRGRWRGFVEGGGALNVPDNIAVQVEHFSEACADLCYASNHMPTLTSQERGDVSLSWLLGAGVDYRLGRHWSLGASPILFGQRGQTGLLFKTSINVQF